MRTDGIRIRGWRRSLLVAVLSLGGCTQEADRVESRSPSYDNFEPGSLHPEAPPETRQFGQLVGVWDARQVSRNSDGSWSGDTIWADWIWRYVLGGHAVQDEWIVPPLSDHASPRFHGVIIRIYSPGEKLWHIAWTDTRGRKFSQFTATGDSARIVMTGVDARGRLARNIFGEITLESFVWTKEWNFEDGATWVPVSRIRCTRKR